MDMVCTPLKIMALVWTPPKFQGHPPRDVFDTFPKIKIKYETVLGASIFEFVKNSQDISHTFLKKYMHTQFYFKNVEK